MENSIRGSSQRVQDAFGEYHRKQREHRDDCRERHRIARNRNLGLEQKNGRTDRDQWQGNLDRTRGYYQDKIRATKTQIGLRETRVREHFEQEKPVSTLSIRGKLKFHDQSVKRSLESPVIHIAPEPKEIPGEPLGISPEPAQTPQPVAELPQKSGVIKSIKSALVRCLEPIDQALDWMVDRLNAVFYPPKPKAEPQPKPELDEPTREQVLEGTEDANPQSDMDLDPELEAELAERDFEIIEQAEEAERLFLALDKSIEANAKAKADPMKKILNRIEDEEAKGLFDDLNDAIEKNVKAKVKEKEQSKEQSKGISR